MSKNLHEDYSTELPGLPSDRSTGVVFAIVALVVVVIWRDIAWVVALGGVVAAGFIAASLCRASILRPLNIVWFKFALLLNKVVSPLIMLVIFCTTIVPFGAIMRLRADPLRRKQPTDPSYWINRDREPSSMTNQF